MLIAASDCLGGRRAIAELEETTKPKKVGFFQLCGGKCGKALASRVFYNILGTEALVVASNSSTHLPVSHAL